MRVVRFILDIRGGYVLVNVELSSGDVTCARTILNNGEAFDLSLANDNKTILKAIRDGEQTVGA